MMTDPEPAASQQARTRDESDREESFSEPGIPVANRPARLAAARKAGERLVLDEHGQVRDEVARRVVAFVGAYNRTHKEGPTWQEVGLHMGWSREESEGVITALRRAGILYATPQHRSLRVHPRLAMGRRPR
ncbi:hypothetical protein [Sanguibacter sp. 25GB23B1]|uniref:hypothetical protein n=1 Tax=unclassified Sanguibacter TaxID=2645534 RepID=UPI0032AEFECB